MQLSLKKLAVVVGALCVFSATSPVSAELFAHSYHQGVEQVLQYGPIEGVKQDGILAFLNVPYAKAPSGSLRFGAPQDLTPWTQVLKTQEPGPDFIQPRGTGTHGSETALNMNIFRPDNDHTGLPILVYIHGGNNQTGSAQDLLPSKLVQQGDVVVVSINYRLGLLGFNPLPALKYGTAEENSGNYTLLDIKKALDFLHDNAFAFGGNPENITVSGFSAGGRDVMALLISPLFKDSFAKAISFSGGMTTADPGVSAEIVAERLAGEAAAAGISREELLAPSPNARVKDFLMQLDAAKLAGFFGDAGIRMASFPHLYEDGVTLPREGFETQHYNSLPLIMLTGSTEFSGFATGDPYFAEGMKEKRYLEDEDFAAAFAFAVKYGSELYGLFNAQESAVRMFPYYEAPIYTCSINYGADPEIVGKDMAFLTGATHGIFLPFLTDEAMGPRAAYPESFDNAGAKELTQTFMQYVINFLWTDTPNGQGLPRWEAWTGAESGPSELILDATKDKAVITQSYARTSYTGILEAMEADDSVSDEVKEDIIHRVLNGRWWSAGLDERFGNADPFAK